MLPSESLQEQCQHFEDEGNLEEAYRVHKQILQLKKQTRKQEKKNLKLRHKQELQQVDAAFTQEHAAFTENWDSKLDAFQTTCKDNERQLREKHREAAEALEAKLQETLPNSPKPSPDYLNLKKIQDLLIRKKDYKQAIAVKTNMESLREKDKLCWANARSNKISLQLSNLNKQHQQELKSYKQRRLKELDELVKQRAQETECLLKKYQNARNELEKVHTAERKQKPDSFRTTRQFSPRLTKYTES